ncbi:MAG TPA: AAA family ATPase [Acidimicrobiales bacterium]|nr:AAA family ATPase [Acidimicrobiales bacterium]
MTTPSEEQGSGMPAAPEDAAAGQPPGETAEVVKADETPAGGMKLSGEAGADGAPVTAGGHTNGDVPGGGTAAAPDGGARQTWGPSDWQPSQWQPSQWQPAQWTASSGADGTDGDGAPAQVPGELAVVGAHGQPAPPPFAGTSGGGGAGGNGAVDGGGSHPFGDEPPLEVLPKWDTRKPRSLWMRSRLLILIAAVWGLLFWYALSSDPLLSVHDGLVQTWNSKWWLAALFAAELVRQIHYIVCEHWGAYNHFWMDRVFAANRPKGRMSDWARYRAKRIFTIIIAIGLIAVIAGAAFQTSPIQGLFLIPSKLVSLAGYIVYVIFILLLVVGQFAAIFFFLSRGGVDTYFPDDIKTRFTSVWGQDAVLEHVKESMVFLEDPESIEQRGGYVPGGILLWGPPGTGKTLMAEAVAGETGKPFVFVDPGAFINMFMGVGVLKVKSVFRKLRKLALRYGGVIVFFDEADSLGNRGMISGPGVFGPGGVRGMQEQGPWVSGDCHGGSYLSESSVSALLTEYQKTMQRERVSVPDGRRGVRDRGMMMGGMMGGGGMGTLQAMLGEMSGLKKPRGFMNRFVRRILGMKPKPPPKYRILIMMATNMPNSLDEAMLRPGRIDRIFRVGYPSKAGRVRTYEGYFENVRNELTAEDIDKLATITPYATGATIKDLVNESLIVALRNKHDAITWADVLEAKRLKELGPPEEVEYVERERHAVAIHEACHAVVAYKVRKHLEIDLATIEKGSTYLGMVSSIKPEDRFTSWRSEYEADVMVSLASLAGERLFFGGDSSSGVSGDLESATTIAQLMEGYWGMGSTIASRASRRNSGGWPQGGGEGEMMGGEGGKKVEERLTDLLARTHDLLEENKLDVYAVAHALESHKTLSGEDIEAVIEGKWSRGIDGRVYKVTRFVEVFDQYHERIATSHLNRQRVSAALPNPVEWAPELVAEASNGNGHVAPEEELEGVGAASDASAAGEWGLPQP